MNQLSNLAENMQAESEQLKQFMTQKEQKTLNEMKKLLEIFCQKRESSIENYIKQVEKKIDQHFENSKKALDQYFEHSKKALDQHFEHSKKAIDSMSRYRISKTLKFSVAILSIMGIFIAGMGGTAWWMSNMIKDNAQQIIQQNEVLKLEGLEMLTIEGKTYITAPFNTVKKAYVNQDNTLQVWELN